MRHSSALGPFAACLLASLVLLGCDEDEASTTAELPPAVTPLSLPLSLRYQTDRPADPLTIEIAPSTLRLNGQEVLALDNGKLPAGEYADGRIGKLFQAVELTSVRQSAIVRTNAMVPYGTVAKVLGTLERSNFHSVYFEVRPGGGLETAFLPVERFRALPPEDERNRIAFEGEGQRTWDEFVGLWEQVEEACNRADAEVCDRKPRRVAEGGDLHITLWSRGAMSKVEFRRIGVEGEEGENASHLERVQILEAIAAAGGENEPPPPPPNRFAAFSWRVRANTAQDSAISAAMRPLCGAAPCKAVIVSEMITPVGNVISFVGAAFPNGTPPLDLDFIIPAR